MSDTTDADTDSATTSSIVSNRSEIVFLYDAQDADPNGNPLSPSGRPRIDPVTNQALVTDVRLKRYLRDQLSEDGHGVYVANIRDDNGDSPTREYLAKQVSNVDSESDIGPEFLDTFLEKATDVRYFGATLPFSTDDDGIAKALATHLPQQLTGAVQFGVGRSIHPVRENENYDSLTSVISTGEGNPQGGFQLDDNRIVYGLIGFSATVNENTADTTQLTTDDVARLDTLCWRSVKNQANSRSKSGQHPRLYVRIEYTDGFHAGNLDRTLELGDDSKPAEELTTVSDASVDVSNLITRLDRESSRIETIHLAHDPFLTLEGVDGELLETDGSLASHIESVANVDTHEIDIADEYTDTLPNND